MNNKLWMNSFSALIGFAMLLGCGSTDEAALSTTTYSTVTVANSTESDENGELKLTKVESCTVDADTGRADFIWSNGTQKKLTLAVKAFASTNKAYTCTQAADNSSALDSVGLKFDSCMVDLALPSVAQSGVNNIYGMHRANTSVKLFSYSDSCSITITSATGEIAGTLNCTGMIQTHLDGAPRNPVDESATMDLSGDFMCPKQ
jgi:hypothetical protein